MARGRRDVEDEDVQEPQETCLISMLLGVDEDGFVECNCFDGFLNGVPASFFFSNNSSHTFVSAQAMERAGLQFSSTTPKLCRQLHVRGHDMMTLGTVVSPFRIQEYAADAFEFQVLRTITAFDVVLGGDWIRQFGQVTYSRAGISFPITLRHSTVRRRRVH